MGNSRGCTTSYTERRPEKELKLQKPNFIFPSVSLPCLPPDDTISVTELEEIIGCPLTAEALDAKIAELEAEEKIRQMTE
jgi:hypothetical protein